MSGCGLRTNRTKGGMQRLQHLCCGRKRDARSRAVKQVALLVLSGELVRRAGLGGPFLRRARKIFLLAVPEDTDSARLDVHNGARAQHTRLVLQVVWQGHRRRDALFLLLGRERAR